MKFTIRMSGGDELNRKLTKLGSAVKTDIREQGARDSGKLAMGAIPAPPPPLPSYHRTGRLERGFHSFTRHAGQFIESVIENTAPYAPWVISSRRIGGIGPQAKIHYGRWYRLEDVLQQIRPRIVETYRAAIRRYL